MFYGNRGAKGTASRRIKTGGVLRPAVLVLLFSLNAGCVLNGPDVVSAYKVEERLSKLCYARALTLPAGENLYPGSGFIAPAALCGAENKEYLKDVMVLTSAADDCEQAVFYAPADNYGDFVVLYVLIRNYVCDLKPVRVGDFRKGFQWGT